jgi:hypothetical protein
VTESAASGEDDRARLDTMLCDRYSNLMINEGRSKIKDGDTGEEFPSMKKKREERPYRSQK